MSLARGVAACGMNGGLGGGGNGEMLVKGTKFQLCKMNKFWRSNGMVTTDNNTVLYT